MRTDSIPALIILTWLFTPASLNLASRATGLAGGYVIVSILAAAAFLISSSFILYNKRVIGPKQIKKSDPEMKRSKTMGSGSLLLTGRLPLLLFGSTGMLVSAGFAFNEIFLYWFPNFLFASLLLAGVVVLNGFGEKAAMAGQLCFVSVVILSLCLVFTMALPGHPKEVVLEAQQNSFSFESVSLLLLCLVGFDFYQPRKIIRSYSVFIVLMVLFLTCWSLMSLRYLDQKTLSESMVSYMKFAREAGGENGRYLMGVVVIAGVAAGVNGLFIVSRRALVHAMDLAGKSKHLQKRWLVVILFGVAIETMMMTGFAGKEIFEVQLQATLILWLVHLTLRLFLAGRKLAKFSTGYFLLSLLLCLFCVAVITSLVLMSENTIYVMMFTLSVALVIVLLTIIWQKSGPGGFGTFWKTSRR